jgi:hypothetical protein
MLDFSIPVIISIVDQGRLEFRRSNVPGQVPPLSQGERDCWQEVHAAQKPAESNESGSTIVRGWPIHEPNWRREILRLELSDEW